MGQSVETVVAATDVNHGTAGFPEAFCDRD